jgi:photosystem II stability/assembly factor-like uncharacterized protein
MEKLTIIFTTILCFAVTFVFLVINSSPHRQSEQEREALQPTGAMAALDFWTRSRAYPDNDIPASKYYQAFVSSKKTIKEFSRTTQSATAWEPIGPTNLSGRAVSVAINPLNGNTVYVGTASGGLWRSYSGGQFADWQRVTTGYPVNGIGAIAIDPTDSNTIYIGTGEVYRYSGAYGGLVVRTTRGSYGLGILKTTDGGLTWAKSLDWSLNQQRGVQALRFNPLNHNTILAATTEGLYKTSDAGTTWYQTDTDVMAMDIVINPSDTTLCLATVGNFNSLGHGLYISFDAGNTWFLVGSFPNFTGKAMLDIYPAHPNVVYASVADSTTGAGGLWQSTDFGGSWTRLNNSSIFSVQGWYSHFVAVHPTDSSRIVQASVGIYYSTNGGRSLLGSSGSYSDHHSYAHHPTNPNILYIVNDDGVYRTNDFGVHYTFVGNGMQTGQLYNGFSNSTTDSLLALTQSQDHIPGYIYRGSVVWGSSASDESGWTAIDPTNDNNMYAVTRWGESVTRSTNRGVSFTGGTNFTPDVSWNSPLVVSPSNSSILYFGRDLVYKSIDKGVSWSLTSSAVADGNYSLSVAISSTNPDTLYIGKAPVATHAHIFRTTNGGGGWTDITGSLPDRYPLDLAVDPNNSRVVYAAMGGYGTGHLFKSTNSGGVWTDISGTLPDVPVTAVVVDPANSNYVYAGSDIGVYISTNSGTTWAAFSDGFPDAVLVSDLTISLSNRVLRATTHGNGVFQRKLANPLTLLTVLSPNGGEHWNATTTHQISWTRAQVTPVRIEYSTDDGSSWNTIASNVPATSTSYNWLIPHVTSYGARVRVVSLFDSTIVDQSDAPFTLLSPTVTTSVISGWNLLSLPVKAFDSRKTSLFPNAITAAFAYEATYVTKETLAVGHGYWLRFNAGESVPLIGDSVTQDTIPVNDGWNLIGSISTRVPALSLTSSPPSIIISKFYGYTSNYQTADTIQPGQGYWVKTNGAGTLIISSSLAKHSAPQPPDTYLKTLNSLTLTDQAGHSQTLYFGTSADQSILQQYEMPPLPPQDVFDVRFITNRMMELSNPGESHEYLLAARSVIYPLTLRWRVHEQKLWKLITEHGEQILSGEGTITLSSSSDRLALHVDGNGTSQQPKEFALLQNYPNPFNPSTEISYQIPEEAFVTLQVYDAIGKEVATLINNEKKPSGTHTVRWNSDNTPSGVYFYKIISGHFTQTRKMILLR